MSTLTDKQTDDQRPDVAASSLHPVQNGATWALVPRPEDPAAGIAASARYFTYELHSSILSEDRRVIVYVPEEYERDPERRFPVFYLHDGQNLFDGKTSYVAGCTWRAHITADALAATGVIEPVILVGIYNTGLRRMAEYTPDRDPALGGGDGDLYGQMIAEKVKPFLDEHFRTLPDRRNTALGGSSLGGLISLHLGLKHPDLYGKVAVLSPSVWWNNRRILETVRGLRARPDLQIWLDMGTAEGARHLRDADQLYRLLLRGGWRSGLDLLYWRAEGAVHDESAWADRFDRVLQFLFPARLLPAETDIAERPDIRDT